MLQNYSKWIYDDPERTMADKFEVHGQTKLALG